MKRMLGCWLLAGWSVWLLRTGLWAEVRPVDYLGHAAFEITDGRTRAVVVPRLGGRVMWYGRVGGPNLMWNLPEEAREESPRGFVNWGGDKTLIGPHDLWKKHSERRWPPRPSWISEPHDARVMEDGTVLVTEGPEWEGFRLRVVRRYSMDGEGRLEILQRLEKTDGGEEPLAVWPVAQTRVPDRVRVLRRAGDPEAYHVFRPARDSLRVREVDEETLEVTFPDGGGANKVSVFSPRPLLEAWFGDTRWRMTGELVEGERLEPAPFRTPPVEIYTQGGGEMEYVELELMSPAVRLSEGSPAVFRVHWALEEAARGGEPDGDESSAAEPAGNH